MEVLTMHCRPAAQMPEENSLTHIGCTGGVGGPSTSRELHFVLTSLRMTNGRNLAELGTARTPISQSAAADLVSGVFIGQQALPKAMA